MSNWDTTSPADGDIISQFPANERAARLAVMTNFSVEHHSTDDENVGKHEVVTLLDNGGAPTVPAGQVAVYNDGGVLKTRAGTAAAQNLATEAYAVAKAGDTMTGNLTVEKGSPRIALSQPTGTNPNKYWLIVGDDGSLHIQERSTSDVLLGAPFVYKPSEAGVSFETVGVRVGAPTGGSKGTGSVNAETLYKNNVPVDAFPSGTRMVFHQASAPPGWTQSDAVNDRVLRVVSSAGGGAGGTWTISGLSASTTVDYHALTLNEIPPHSHWNGVADYSTNAFVYGTGTTDMPGDATTGLDKDGSATYQGRTSSVGIGLGHNHPASTSISSNGAWRPAYADVIIAEKN